MTARESVRSTITKHSSARTRRLAALVVATTVLAGFVVTGLLFTPPSVRPRLLAGDIWLASRAVGELTLVNGVAAEVSAAVGVTGPGADFVTEQSDGSGYAVETATGEVIGVNDSTLQETPTTVAGDMTAVYPGADALFAVDVNSRTVQLVGSGPAADTGATDSLPGTDPALASEGDTLWAVDGRSGTLVSYQDSGGRLVRRTHSGLFAAQRNNPELTVANGSPVVVDPMAGTASLLTSGGQVDRAMRLMVAATDLVSGSSDSDAVDIVAAGRTTLTVCDFTARDCTAPIRLPGASGELGAAQQTDGHVFVPDYGAEVVHAVDLATGAVVTTPRLFDNPVRFQLLERDNIVYVNDPDSNRAAVISPDGTIRRIDKYQPPHPNTQPVTTTQHPTRPGPPVPTTVPIPVGTGTTIPGPGSAPALPGGTTTAPTTPTGPGPHIIGIVVDPTTPEVGQSVSFSADVTGVPDTWAWTVTAPTGRTETTAATPNFRHTFDLPGVYTTELVIHAGTLRDQQSTTLTVIPRSPPVQCGETLTQSVVVQNDLTCSGIALTIGASDITVDLNNHTVKGSQDGINAESQVAGVTVEDGTIVGGAAFQSGPSSTLLRVHVDSVNIIANDFTIEDSSLTSFHEDGSTNTSIIDTSASGGTLRFSGGTNSFLDGSDLSDEGVAWELAEQGGDRVIDNTFVNSSLTFLQSDDETVSGNTFTGSFLHIFDSDEVAVRNNDFADANTALVLDDVAEATDASITQNSFTGNQIGIVVAPFESIQISDGRITDNTFTDNREAGVDVEIGQPSAGGTFLISGNTFVSNGGQSGGAVDAAGHPIEDGLHIDVPAGTGLVVSDNVTRDNANFGIYAQPGSVVDGGGNTSRGNPSGCLGVVCG